MTSTLPSSISGQLAPVSLRIRERLEAAAAPFLANDNIAEHLLPGELDQLVLDELGLALELGYLPAAEVLAALEQRPPHLDVILTGPCMSPALLAMADQVTQLRRGF